MQTNELTKILRAAKLRVTPLRLAALEYLAAAGQPLSHTDVQAGLPDADRVTLYRILTAFVETNIAHQVQGLDGAWRFCVHTDEGNGCPGDHPHFLCTTCGRMTCLLDQKMPHVNVPEGCHVEGKQLVAYGKCPACTSGQKIN